MKRDQSHPVGLLMTCFMFNEFASSKAQDFPEDSLHSELRKLKGYSPSNALCEGKGRRCQRYSLLGETLDGPKLHEPLPNDYAQISSSNAYKTAGTSTRKRMLISVKGVLRVSRQEVLERGGIIGRWFLLPCKLQRRNTIISGNTRRKCQ